MTKLQFERRFQELVKLPEIPGPHTDGVYFNEEKNRIEEWAKGKRLSVAIYASLQVMLFLSEDLLKEEILYSNNPRLYAHFFYPNWKFAPNDRGLDA